jgi:2-dehydro-3-deoxyphosphooctonate aldolase (KDO 8-P synthase)
MDCTHSVQRPGGSGGKTGGDRKFVPAMAKAAKAFGTSGYFMEVHPDPDKGLSDAANMMRLDEISSLITILTTK